MGCCLPELLLTHLKTGHPPRSHPGPRRENPARICALAKQTAATTQLCVQHQAQEEAFNQQKGNKTFPLGERYTYSLPGVHLRKVIHASSKKEKKHKIKQARVQIPAPDPYYKFVQFI